MTWRDAFHRSPLARRLIFWTILFSSCVTLILTGLQLYRDYRRDLDQIEQNFTQIEAVHRATLANSLWATDKERLQLQLEGMLQLRDMRYFEINEGGQIWVRAGRNIVHNAIRREIPLRYWHNGREQILGSLLAVATLDNVYDRLLSEALAILISNGIKTFLVAVFMLFLIHHQVTRHLAAISRFAQQFNLVEPPLILDRAPRDDELWTTVSALNHMRDRLNEFIAKIADSEERFRVTFEQAAVGVAQIAPDGRWLRVNQSLCDIVGYSREELLAKTFQAITHPDDLETDRDQVREMLAGRLHAYSMEKRCIHNDGHIVWVNLSASLVRKASGKTDYFIAVIENIDDRLFAERELRRSETLLAESQRIAHLGSFEWEVQGGHLRWSAELYRIYGVTPQNFTPSFEAFIARVHLDDREHVRSIMSGILKNGESASYEQRVLRPSGEVRLLATEATPAKDMHGRVVRIIGACHDITERRQAEKTLAGVNAQLHELLTNMADGFVRLDRDWRYVFVNKRAGKLFGRNPEELLGKNIWQEFPEGVGQAFDIAYQKAMVDQQPCQIQSYYPPWDKWFENRIYPAPNGLSIFFDDITERKYAEVEREKLLGELTRRNVEMEAFIYTISHDLKSPLITIGGFSTLLGKDIARGDSEAVADSLIEIKKAVGLMQTHIQDLLLLSRTGRVNTERTKVALSVLFGEVIGQFGRRIADEQAQLVVAPDLPEIEVDYQGFVRVYTNLIDNALKYRRAESAPCIEIGWQQQADELRLFVRDNGQGIKKEYQQRIFGLFQRADSKTEGTGVGLAISKRVIEVHGGRMWVESAPGKGSTFWIALPAAIVVKK